MKIYIYKLSEITGNLMEKIELTLGNGDIEFEFARKEARAIAEKDNSEAEILSWHNRDANTQSPCCLKCDFGGTPAWEVFGKNHGGRLKIIVNDGQFVFITS